MVVSVNGKSTKKSAMQAAVDLVREEFERSGMSMTEFAKKLGCGRPYLYRVLQGAQSPSLEWITAAMEKLGIRMEINFSKSA